VSGFLFWVLSGVLFLAAVSCAVFGVLVGDRENPYLARAAWAVWIYLCVALGLVLRAALL
jgi:hypothetical protein